MLEFFLIKFQALGLQLYYKEPQHRRLPQIFKNIYFRRTLPVAASEFSGNLKIFRMLFIMSCNLINFYEDVLVCSTNMLLINVLCFDRT